MAELEHRRRNKILCGRYTLSKRDSILQRFRVVLMEYQLEARYNIAPTQKVPVIIPKLDGSRELAEMRWGLIPSWVKDLKTHKLLINARAETIAEKPSFKQALMKRRCIIPADGFYEWQVVDGKKNPVHIHLENKELFGFAGLWDQWTSEDGEVILSCTIITIPANDKLRSVHTRMPVILNLESEEKWLDPNIKDPNHLLPLLSSYADEKIQYYPVSKIVNTAAVDSVECIAPTIQ